MFSGMTAVQHLTITAMCKNKKCRSDETTEYSQPGGGIQYRCLNCGWFAGWKELPVKTAKKSKKTV